MRPKSSLKILGIIHASMCISLALFASFAFLKNGSFRATTANYSLFVYVIPVVAMAGYFGSKFIVQNLINQLPKDEPLAKKLKVYQLAHILKYALLEGPAFFALGIYYIDGNAMYLVIALSLMVYLFFQRPSIDRLKSDLPLSLQEEKEFDTLNL